MNNITEVEGSGLTNDDTSAASGTENRADPPPATSPEEDSDQGEQAYFPSEEELQTYQNGRLRANRSVKYAV